jgi:hypothetical protein
VPVEIRHLIRDMSLANPLRALPGSMENSSSSASMLVKPRHGVDFFESERQDRATYIACGRTRAILPAWVKLGLWVEGRDSN